MDFPVVAGAAFAASLLTFFSGFGLGTILLPVFAIWFPVEVAVALTAIVHLLNNVFKLGLLYKHIDKDVALRFGLPAVISAFAGAYLLTRLAQQNTAKPVIGALLIGFTLFEMFNKYQFSRRQLALGGLLSGFFGGLSGHQGALRSAFLLRSGLTKEAFLATGVVIACAVDVVRLSLYSRFQVSHSHIPILLTSTCAALSGALVGNFLLTKITLTGLKTAVSAGLLLMGVAMILGYV